MENVLQDKLLNVTQQIERQVDAAIEQIENLDVNDLEYLRKRRVQELKAKEEKRKHWLEIGHGGYEQLPEEKSFFDVVKKSDRVVVHFFTNTSSRSPIIDMHLKKLAPKHVETRFVSINAEKCPFLAEKLRVKTIPTLVLVKDGVMVDKIVGFTQLGNKDDFTTETLEWRIAQNDVIDYEGDLSVPPELRELEVKKDGRRIRDGAYNDCWDDLEELGSLDTIDEACKLDRKGGKSAELELTAEEAKELGLDEDN